MFNFDHSFLVHPKFKCLIFVSIGLIQIYSNLHCKILKSMKKNKRINSSKKKLKNLMALSNVPGKLSFVYQNFKSKRFNLKLSTT
jgi:hypothetical protein